jgi:uncharacterized protein YkwD
VRRHFRSLLGALLAMPAALPPAGADALSTVQMLRAGGCGGILPTAPPVHRAAALDRIAEQWAGGLPLATAAEGSGYRPELTGGFHFMGTRDSMIQQLRRSGCNVVLDRAVRDIGVYQRNSDTWLVVLSPAVASTASAAPAAAFPGSSSQRPGSQLPSGSQQGSGSALPPQPPRAAAPPVGAVPLLATRALELVNEVRARGTRCGARAFAPAPPLTFSGTLAGVALGHAADMAAHDYFEHENRAGKSPADRVRASGYLEKWVGENIAYGPKTIEDVVQGWLDSPGHCENIMDPRFVEMGIAYAAGRTSRHGLYWVQLLAEPRA